MRGTDTRAFAPGPPVLAAMEAMFLGMDEKQLPAHYRPRTACAPMRVGTW